MYNSLYSTSEIFKGYPQMFPESTKFCRMMDDRLEGILAELKNSKVPFVRTGEPDACRYWDFKMICGR